MLGLEVILQNLRLGGHFCGDHGASAPPPSHRLIKITKDTRCRIFKNYVCFVHNNPETEAQKELRVVSVERVFSLSFNSVEREPVLRGVRVTPLGFCLRVIVNETYINLEKTTSRCYLLF